MALKRLRDIPIAGTTLRKLAEADKPKAVRRRPWAKFWSEKWIASSRVRKTNYQQQGLWLAIAARVHSTNQGGSQRHWTPADVAEDLGIYPSRRKRFHRDLEVLVDLELVTLFEGFIILPRFEALQINTKRELD
jgi:hypothetical protein